MICLRKLDQFSNSSFADHDSRSVRGVALLLVLGVLVTASTAAALVARAANAHQSQLKIERDGAVVHALRTGVDSAIAYWLEEHASSVVLPPDIEAPSAVVLVDRIGLGDGRVSEVLITAFDQLGMTPSTAMGGGGQIAQALPAALSGLDLGQVAGDIDGLDLLIADASDAGLRVFPLAISTEWAEFGSFRRSDVRSSAEQSAVGSRAVPALGALVASHNPLPWSSRRNGAVNVSTAPMWLVRAALRASGRTGADQIARARARGMPVPAPGAGSADEQLDSGAPELVGSSGLWSFRIDLSCGRVRESWWETYVRTGSGWALVQRLRILEPIAMPGGAG